MRKIILIVLVLFFFVGCTQIEDKNIDDVTSMVLTSKVNLSNQYRTGYKYYAPRGISVKNNAEYNEQLGNNKYNYYLYIDVVSYYNNVIENYEVNEDAYYSNKILYKDKYGYLEINKIDNKNRYLIEMMYNYAKIEVIVYEVDIKETVLNAITILSSIEYNKEIINNLMGENVLEFNEVEINIFETKKTDSNYLKFVEEYGFENEEENLDNQ